MICKKCKHCAIAVEQPQEEVVVKCKHLPEFEGQAVFETTYYKDTYTFCKAFGVTIFNKIVECGAFEESKHKMK